MNCEASKSSLSAKQKHLLELMQQINFGRIEGIAVCNGEPVLDPPPRTIREIKFMGENGPRPELKINDYSLKQEVVEFFKELGRMHNGIVEKVEVKHGLPFRMTINESSNKKLQ